MPLLLTRHLMQQILVWHLVLLEIFSGSSLTIGNDPTAFFLIRHRLMNQSASPSNTRPATPPIAAPAITPPEILLFSAAAPSAGVVAVLPAAVSVVSVLSDRPRPTML